MDIGIYYSNVSFSSRIEYVIEFLNNHGLCPEGVRILSNPAESQKKICYGHPQGPYDLVIPAQDIFFSTKNFKTESLISNRYSFEALIIYGVEKDTKALMPFCNEKSFAFDILESIFFHISRYEEFHCENGKKNKWDMMKSEEMFIVKNGLEKIPLVDHIVYSFFNCLGIISHPPQSRIIISHDIDHIRKYNNSASYLKKLVGHIRRGELNLLKKWREQVRKHKRYGIDPYDVFDWMLVKDENPHNNVKRKNSIESNKMIFYLMGGKSIYDSPIPPKDPIFLRSIKTAKERGYLIGTHPSYEGWIDKELAEMEKGILEKATKGKIKVSRQHYLHFQFPKTIRILEKMGIKVESSLGFYDRIGFRCGTGFMYKLYDLEEEKSTQLWELPLVFMDSAIIRESKRTGDANEMIRITNSFLESNKYFTCITCNFHNSRFDEADMRGWPLRRVYEKFIKYFKGEQNLPI